MNHEKGLLKGLTALLVCVALAACSSGGAGSAGEEALRGMEAPAQGGESAAAKNKVLYSNGAPMGFFETPWLNPGSYLYTKVLYSHLVVADENLNPIPGHADALADYSLSEDGRTLKFELREDAYWHDGEKITPEDIKWSIEYSTKTSILNALFHATFSAISGSDGGKAETFDGIVIDGNRLTITFDKIVPDALLTFTQFAPLPEKYFKDVEPAQFQQAAYFQRPVGSGPFCIDEVSMNNYTILKPFELYYNGVADFNISLYPSAGDSDPNMVSNAKAGRLDYGYTKMIADVQALEGTEGIDLSRIDVRYTRLFFVNQFPNADGTPAALADKRVRQAIRYAIDMDAICSELFMGAAVPADCLIPGASDKAAGLNPYEYNPEKAKRLLAEAGWDSNTGIQAVYYYTDQGTADLMSAVQGYLADVGIKMTYRLVEGDLAADLWKAPEDQVNGVRAVDWDLCYGANAALSLHEYYDRYLTGSATNSHTPQDETLNALIRATNASMDAGDQIKAFKELSKYENESLFTMALYYQPIFVVTSDKLSDEVKIATPQFNYDWDIQHWKLNG